MRDIALVMRRDGIKSQTDVGRRVNGNIFYTEVYERNGI